jgi:hypothetical protein
VVQPNSREPHQNYVLDLLAFRLGRIDDGVLQFSAAGTEGSGPDQAERDRVPAAA